MIPKIEKAGTSFKGLAAYLTHDPKEKTAERVAWTHTLNLAHDDPLSAVDEMLWTARAAELLKQEAGIRAGGRATETPVKHFSLNWSPEDDPTREQMIETAEDFLRHMNWQDHQSLLVAHNDKAYAHVHVMVNAVHPETGLKLDEGFERRRAQAWALAYEQEHGRIYCEQRLLAADAREDSPSRPVWMAFKGQEKEFRIQENSCRVEADNADEKFENPKIAEFSEWKELKEIQRDEREAFFAEGKLAFSELRRSIYREAREEFRDRWVDFYAARKNGTDAGILADLKRELVAEQKQFVDARRDEACGELRKSRDIEYRELLDDQRDIRHQMRWRQESGLDNAIFLQVIENRDAGKDRGVPTFRDAADEAARAPVTEHEADAVSDGEPRHQRHGMKSEIDIGTNIAAGVGLGLVSFLGAIADGLVGSTPAPRPKQPEPEPKHRADPFEAVIAATRAHEQREREDASDEYRRRQRSYGE